MHFNNIKGLLFDKDGTIFDFHASWAAWCGALVTALAHASGGEAKQIGAAVGYDVEQGRFLHGSSFVVNPFPTTISLMAEAVPDWEPVKVSRFVRAFKEEPPQIPAAPLKPLFSELRGRGLKIGLSTNGYESASRRQLQDVEILDQFDFIAGSDSGFGAKPEPGMQLEFLRQTGLAPHEVAMIGDGLHDLNAGRAAGMRTIGVLTGSSTEEELTPFADVVLPDIGHLPACLSG